MLLSYTNKNWVLIFHYLGYAAAAKSLQSCPTLWPHRRQPTRSPRPWDSPGKNTGMGCHLLLQYMKVKSESEVAQSCLTLCDLMDCSPPGSSIHEIFPGKSTGVGCHCLLHIWVIVWLKILVFSSTYTYFSYLVLKRFVHKIFIFVL